MPGRDAGADGIESLVSEQVRAERQAAKAAPLPHLQNEIEDGDQSAQVRPPGENIPARRELVKPL